MLLLLDSQLGPRRGIDAGTLDQPASLKSTPTPRTEVAPLSSPVSGRKDVASRDSCLSRESTSWGRGVVCFLFFSCSLPSGISTASKQASLVDQGPGECGPLDLAYFDVNPPKPPTPPHTQTQAEPRQWMGDGWMVVASILPLCISHHLQPAAAAKHTNNLQAFKP